jgi:hypothetical protein
MQDGDTDFGDQNAGKWEISLDGRACRWDNACVAMIERRNPMRLTIVSKDGSRKDLQFSQGPVYLGRQQGSHVFLPGGSVSRQHAVIYATQAGEWILEDLDSANKTFLNGKAIHKSALQNGNEIRISEYQILVELSEKVEPHRFEPPSTPPQATMADTVVTVHHDEMPSITRKMDPATAEPIQMPINRFRDLAYASKVIFAATGLPQLHRTLQDLLLDHLSAVHAWVGLKKKPGGFEIQGGRMVTSQTVDLQELAAPQAITEAVEKLRHELVPQIPRNVGGGKIRSAIASPICQDKTCIGILYAENSTQHEHYTQADLDYLILLSILASAVMQVL